MTTPLFSSQPFLPGCDSGRPSCERCLDRGIVNDITGPHPSGKGWLSQIVACSCCEMVIPERRAS